MAKYSTVKNNGVVGLLKFEFVMNLITFFWRTCNLRMWHLQVCPQAILQYIKWGTIILLYRVTKVCWGKKNLSLEITPVLLETLEQLLFKCFFQDRCSSTVTPQNCTLSLLIIWWPPTVKGLMLFGIVLPLDLNMTHLVFVHLITTYYNKTNDTICLNRLLHLLMTSNCKCHYVCIINWCHQQIMYENRFKELIMSLILKTVKAQELILEAHLNLQY